MKLIWKTTEKPVINQEFTKCIDKLTSKFEKSLDDITIAFNPKMRSRGGWACWQSRHIELNERLLDMNPDHLLQTFVHELCHILTYDVYGTKRVQAHGYQWQAMMMLMGYPADRTHKMKGSKELKHKRQKWIAKCACDGITHKVGIIRMRKIETGTKYCCNKCRQRITIGEKIQ